MLECMRSEKVILSRGSKTFFLTSGKSQSPEEEMKSYRFVWGQVWWPHVRLFSGCGLLPHI